MKHLFCPSSFLALLVGFFMGLPLSVRASGPDLSISYGGKVTSLTLTELSRMPHQQVRAFDSHEKKEHSYSGIPVRELLAMAGVPVGEALRGRNLRLAVYVRCRDGYDIVYALAEFDDAFDDRVILLVDHQDGLALPDGLGPLRLVAPGDKRPARWARMVTAIEVVLLGDSTTPQGAAPRASQASSLPESHR